MGIFSKTIESAQKAADKAQSVVDEWSAKAAAARAEATELDATADAKILADETAAERITVQVQALQRRARAYDKAAAEAGQKLNAARREALEAEAAEEDKAEAAVLKRCEKHQTEVQAILDNLEALEGVRYVEADEVPLALGERREVTTPRSAQLKDEAYAHRFNAAGIRYFLKTGQATTSTDELNRVLGTRFPTGTTIVPASVAAAVDAGLTLQDA